jgi:hypothetical protein
MKRNALKGIVLNRTVGIEVEGYTRDYRNMSNNGVRHSQLKRDGSLTGDNGYSVRGIEVVTNPINNLDMFDEVFDDITKYQWNIGRGTAGTHIHVDSNDFLLEDKIKMAIFMQMIEKAMFLLVKKYRYTRFGNRNQYCQPIVGNWKRLIRDLDTHCADFNWRQQKKIGNVSYHLSILGRRNRVDIPLTTRYHFVNIWCSSHDTIEFRIFHAIRTAKDAKMFALLAYNLVEMVKHSTLEQLEFIANGIVNDSTNAQDMVNKLCQAVGLEFTFKIHNKELEATVNIAKEATRRNARRNAV